jgi:spoIIIJ-associated protein
VEERTYTAQNLTPKLGHFLRLITENAGLNVDFEVADGDNPHPEIENPEVVVRFSGADVDLLLANKAEVLLALEYLTMEMLRMPPDHHERVCFDANDYRLLRIAELRSVALTAAEKVRRTHTPFRFSPMTSRERRIIHLALRNDAAVRSESAGTGPHRQVVIYPADMPTPPDADRVADAQRLPPRPPSLGDSNREQGHGDRHDRHDRPDRGRGPRRDGGGFGFRGPRGSGPRRPGGGGRRP